MNTVMRLRGVSVEAAKPVPDYGSNVASTWYYCLYCKHAQPTEYQMASHVRYAHYAGEDTAIVLGEDFTNGSHLRILKQRWDEWSLLAANKFHRQVESLRGADDFELEVGDGVPE